MPLAKFSLTPIPDAWEALLDYSDVARMVYAHLVLGRLSERSGLICCRRRTIERALGLKGTELDAAFADFEQSGAALVSDLGDGRTVIALLYYQKIAPPQPNNRRAWLKDIESIPDCPAKDAWESVWPYPAEVPEHTGGRVSRVNHPSITSESPVAHPLVTGRSQEQSRAEQSRQEQSRELTPTPSAKGKIDKPLRQADPRVAATLAAFRRHFVDSGKPCKAVRIDDSGNPASKAVREAVGKFLRRDGRRDLDDYFKRLAAIGPWSWFAEKGGFVPSLGWALRPTTELKLEDGTYGVSDATTDLDMTMQEAFAQLGSAGFEEWSLRRQERDRQRKRQETPKGGW